MQTETETAAKSEPNWWHRDHPIFVPVAAFFTGMLYILVIPGIYGAILSELFSTKRAETLFPYVLVALLVPIGLTVPSHARRFGRYMLFGSVATLIVVVGVAALTLRVLYQRDG